ncbi:DnaN DNA polymerase sliding clamp subunit (PCNA homolog) [uncultured Caudovirales phage]|uniref:DnaN DNA polymerase sliding clamp subunit (PCNA homolog) n=1 Tax=uncultured Caudovirales phage TaxID=2100421 RepID=A0A6J5L462_9CAUD|nr:DnaN DNA polymerase sliding clamp subunit (PCNA homolog) [uncultured Caudovirales phage]
MNFTTNAKILAAHLAILKLSTAAKNKNMPILGCVLVKVEGSVATLATTDLDTTTAATVFAHDTFDGAICIPVKAFVDALKGVVKGDVKIERTAGFKVRLTHDAGESVLLALSADEFPALKTTPELGIKLNPARFRDALNATLYAASKDETRYNLNGVFVDANNMVATDGHRMVRVQGETGFTGESILPRKGLEILTRVLAKAVDPLLTNDRTTNVNENHQHFKCGAFAIAMRLVDGQFPNYQQVIPKLNDKSVSFDHAVLLAALKRCDRNTFAPCKITMALETGVVFSQVNPDTGENKINVVAVATHPFEIALNASYLYEAIENSTSGVVTLRMSDNLSPILVESGLTGTVAVIMPIRL